MIVGPSGIQKTPPVEEALRPLTRLAAQAREAHENELAEYETKLMVCAAQAAAAKKELDKSAKAKADSSELEALARQAQVDCAEEKPPLRRYLINDATVEKLGELLAENPNGLTYYRDELNGLFRTMDRQGWESERGFLLESWNGFGSYTWDRVGRGTIHIPACCLSVFGTIQPGPLTKFLKGALTGDDADGLVPRFQITLYPNPSLEFVNHDRYPNSIARNIAFSVFAGIDQLDPASKGCAVDQDRNIPYLSFDAEAQEFFDQWRVDLEQRLRSGSLNSIMASHISKHRKLVPALALQFHLVDSLNAPRLIPITLQALHAAAAWGQFLEAHANRVYSAAREAALEPAIHLSDKLSVLPNPFAYRDVVQKGWSGLTETNEVRLAVGILEDRGWLRVEDLPTTTQGGRPGARIWINPNLPNSSDEEPQ
jgi:putative DNA primase/helicase